MARARAGSARPRAADDRHESQDHLRLGGLAAAADRGALGQRFEGSSRNPRARPGARPASLDDAQFPGQGRPRVAGESAGHDGPGGGAAQRLPQRRTIFSQVVYTASGSSSRVRAVLAGSPSMNSSGTPRVAFCPRRKTAHRAPVGGMRVRSMTTARGTWARSSRRARAVLGAARRYRPRSRHCRSRPARSAASSWFQCTIRMRGIAAIIAKTRRAAKKTGAEVCYSSGGRPHHD